MVDQPSAAEVGVPLKLGLMGVAATFAIGFLALPVLGRFAHRDLESFALVGVAGFVSVILRPGWPGFLGSAVGLTAYVTVLAAMARFAGLHYLGLALMLPAVAAGACCGTIVNRVRAVGIVPAFRDARVWVAAAAAIALAGGLVLFYIALVTAPGGPP